MKEFTFKVTVGFGEDGNTEIRVALPSVEHMHMIMKNGDKECSIPTEPIAKAIMDATYRAVLIEGMLN